MIAELFFKITNKFFMKKLLFILALTSTFTFAQERKIIPSDNQFSKLYEDEPIFVTENKDSPFLYNQWKKGYLIINNSIIFSQEKIHFDLETGQLIVSSNTEKSVLIEGESLTGFVIDKDENTSRRIFIKVNKETFENFDIKRDFYEMVYNEDTTDFLIKDVKKYVLGLSKNKGYQSNSFEYKKRTNYYIKNNSGKYVETRLNKKNILKVLNDKSSEIKAFVASNKTNFKKEHDVVDLLNYYHTL